MPFVMITVVACETIGPPTIPDDVRTPSLAAVVVETDDRPSSVRRYRLAGGQEVEVDLSNAELGPDGAPDKGDLLLMGSGPDQRTWLIPVPLDPYGSDPGCFFAPWLGRDATDPSIDLVMNGVPFALRLNKAAEFTSSDNRSGVYAVWRTHFCLDASGQLVSYGP